MRFKLSVTFYYFQVFLSCFWSSENFFINFRSVCFFLVKYCCRKTKFLMIDDVREKKTYSPFEEKNSNHNYESLHYPYLFCTKIIPFPFYHLCSPHHNYYYFHCYCEHYQYYHYHYCYPDPNPNLIIIIIILIVMIIITFIINMIIIIILMLIIIIIIIIRVWTVIIRIIVIIIIIIIIV